MPSPRAGGVGQVAQFGITRAVREARRIEPASAHKAAGDLAEIGNTTSSVPRPSLPLPPAFG